MSPNQPSAPDDYFNDLSRQPELRQNALDSPPDRSENVTIDDEPGLPKPKRIACVICRKRKLKCDGIKPSCSTCSRLGHNCAYDEVRRKSGPKRGYVKELEARLAQVETQLKTKILKNPKSTEPRIPVKNLAETNGQPSARGRSGSASQNGSLEGFLNGDPFETTRDSNNNISPPAGPMPDVTADLGQPSWDMIRLGLEEPLPTQEAVDELLEIYLARFHPSARIIHPYRHRAAMNLAPHMRPPVCLRYAMWCIAASMSDKYYGHQEIFYRRARKYAESDEMQGHGEGFVTLAHAQCWVLLASYEFKMMYFPRAWASSGRASRLCLMMGFNRLDGIGLDVKQVTPPPRDWTDREERRRTFWMTYCVDRYASVGTGWPTTLDEKDIMTNLPASDEAYENSVPQQTLTLSEAATCRELSSLSPFGGVVLTAHYFGQNLIHLHQPGPNEQDHDLHGEFWQRHRRMDNALLTTALSLPAHLRLPAGVRNENVVFLNMALHTATISLHQAAIFKAEHNDLPMSIVEQSRTRCLLAAAETTTVMRLSSHLDVASMNPYIPFCLFVAALVFVQHLKRLPNDHEIRTSLEFLISAMQALKRRNPLSESFLIQLGMNLEKSDLERLLRNIDFSASMMKGPGNLPTNSDSLNCSPLIDIRDPRIGKPSHKRLYGAYPEINENIGSNDVTFHGGGTQFSLQNVKIPLRERSSPQLWAQPITDDAVNLGGIRVDANVHGWRVNSPSSFVAGDANAGFDTNMSESNSDEQRSSYPTPPSNNSSSNTSYSSPQDIESENNNSNLLGTGSRASQPSPKSTTGVSAPSPSFYSFVPVDKISPPSSTQDRRQDSVRRDEGSDSFTVPQTWQLGSSGDDTSTLPNLNPGDPGWVQIMEGMMWDGTAMAGELGLENAQWNGQTGSRT
ncbi:hypothetical protein MMC07_009382 [Pseudocyphellaria aurata]|nr:hypothetical protein [Pseudocyphellaria aurata]